MLHKAFLLGSFTLFNPHINGMEYISSQSIAGHEIIALFCRLCDYFPVDIVTYIGSLMIGDSLAYTNMEVVIWFYTTYDHPVPAISFNIDNNTALYCKNYNSPRLISYNNTISLKGHTEKALSGKFSPDGKLVLTCSKDNTACLWDAKTGKLLHQLKGHTDYVHSGAFSLDSKTVLTCSQDKTARLWDTQSGSLLSQLKYHPRGVLGGEFSQRRKIVITHTENQTSYVWKTVPCEASQFIHERSRFLQAWFIVQAAKAKRATGLFRILINSVEHKIFDTFPHYVQEYIKEHFPFYMQISDAAIITGH